MKEPNKAKELIKKTIDRTELNKFVNGKRLLLVKNKLGNLQSPYTSGTMAEYVHKYYRDVTQQYADQETKSKDKEIQKLNLERLMEVEQYELRIKELEEGLRECEEVFDQMEEGSMCKYIEQLLNQNKDDNT